MKSVQFMSAEEKNKVLVAWERFIESNFSSTKFTKLLYNHLIMHCSFIAHYNIGGFYSTYFENPLDTIRFLKQFDRDYGCVSVEYGYAGWLTCEEYSDINNAMVDYFELRKASCYLWLKQELKHIKELQLFTLTQQLEKLKEEIGV